jgi:hypothetical protein
MTSYKPSTTIFTTPKLNVSNLSLATKSNVLFYDTTSKSVSYGLNTQIATDTNYWIMQKDNGIVVNSTGVQTAFKGGGQNNSLYIPTGLYQYELFWSVYSMQSSLSKGIFTYLEFADVSGGTYTIDGAKGTIHYITDYGSIGNAASALNGTQLCGGKSDLNLSFSALATNTGNTAGYIKASGTFMVEATSSLARLTPYIDVRSNGLGASALVRNGSYMSCRLITTDLSNQNGGGIL